LPINLPGHTEVFDNLGPVSTTAGKVFVALASSDSSFLGTYFILSILSCYIRKLKLKIKQPAMKWHAGRIFQRLAADAVREK
jgi:hypothetical protein